MPPHESARDMNRTMFGVLALLTMIVAVLAAAVGDVGQEFEEDRPPIIVHNGSIIFEPEPSSRAVPGGVGRGRDQLWRHELKQAAAPKMLQVTATPSGNVCKDPAVQKLFSQQTANPITIAYGSAKEFQEAVVSISNQNLTVNFGKYPPVHDAATQRLIAYSNNSQVQILRAVVEQGDMRVHHHGESLDSSDQVRRPASKRGVLSSLGGHGGH